MTDSDLPTSRPNFESLNRIGEQTLQARPPKRQHQYPELRPESDPEQGRFSRPLNNVSNPTNAVYFCKICKRFRLGRMLAGETLPRCIGNLDSFNDPDCQLCVTIRHFVKHHWGSQWPVAIEGLQPKVLIQSKPWGSFYDSCSAKRKVHRIMLALDQRPPSLNLMRRALNSDATSKFVLTELEIDPTMVGDTTDSPSLRRPIPLFIDPCLVSGWLKECEDHYSCNENRTPQKSNMVPFFEDGFRLIDVEEGRLVEMRDPCDYVALSYVWGRLEPALLRLYKGNLDALSLPSSLDPNKGNQSTGNQIPGTIADTITLCRSMGQKYLWVDSLCIIQDDAKEKMRLIHGMDRVYENAILTVIALSGSDATAGLAGIRPRISTRYNHGRQNLFNEVHGSNSIAIGRISLREQIQCSHWNTRGWTYQEQLLSPRKLYLSCDEVFYECLCKTRREGYVDDESTKVSLRGGAPWFDTTIKTDPESIAYTVSIPHSRQSGEAHSCLDDQNFHNFVSSYTRRSVTEQGDILNALTGIYHKYYPGFQYPEMNALQAIPTRCFLSSLLWYISSHHCEKRTMVNGFRPSTWSWISRIAAIDFIGAGSTSLWWVEWQHLDDGECSLIDKYCLHFREGNFSYSYPPERHKKAKKPWIYGTEDYGFRTLFSKEEHKTADSSKHIQVMPGVLEFEVPYISKPTTARAIWVEGLGGEWELQVQHDCLPFRIRHVGLFKLDPGEDSFDGFVLLIYNSYYSGLCVKKVGDYFERVGVVEIPDLGFTWQKMANEGLVDFHWKRILLR